MDNIIHLTRACIHTQRTCNKKLANNYTNRRSWCKLANLGRITDPTYFTSNSRAEEMLIGIVITTQVPLAPNGYKPQTKIILDVGGFTLHQT